MTFITVTLFENPVTFKDLLTHTVKLYNYKLMSFYYIQSLRALQIFIYTLNASMHLYVVTYM